LIRIVLRAHRVTREWVALLPTNESNLIRHRRHGAISPIRICLSRVAPTGRELPTGSAICAKNRWIVREHDFSSAWSVRLARFRPVRSVPT